MAEDINDSASNLERNNESAPRAINNTSVALSADDMNMLESLRNIEGVPELRRLVMEDPLNASKFGDLLDHVALQAPHMVGWICQHQIAFLSFFHEKPTEGAVLAEDQVTISADAATPVTSVGEDKSSNGVSTRVLSLQDFGTQSGSPRLSCRTSVRHLSVALDDDVDVQNLPYEAISYAWGDPDDRQQILCDGQAVEIPRSLHEALRKIWSLQPDLLLWADALSIDQKNQEEKAAQVSQMALIFSSARKVHVWTGQLNSHTEAFRPWLQFFEHDDWFTRLVASAVSYVEMRVRQDPNIGAQDTYDFRNDACILGMKDLLARQWFMRAWTYQEIIAARTWILHCGDLHVDGRALERLLEACENTLLDQLKLTTKEREGVTAFCLQLWHVWHVGSKENRGHYLRRSPGHDLLSDLQNIRHRHASDPCDKVNAVIGLHPETKLWPLYQETPVWTFALAARACIEQSESLALLASIGMVSDENENIEGLPSWVVDWRRSYHISTDRRPHKLFVAHPYRLADEDHGWGQYQYYLRMLSVRGIVLGVIWKEPDQVLEERYWLEEIPSRATDSQPSDAESSSPRHQASHRLLGPLVRHVDTSQSCPGKRHNLGLFLSSQDEPGRRGKTAPFLLANSGDFLCILYGAPGLVILKPEGDWWGIEHLTSESNAEQLARDTKGIQPFKFVGLAHHWRSRTYANPNWGGEPLSVPKVRVDNGHLRLSVEKVRQVSDAKADAELDELVEFLTGLDVVPATFVLI